jgi:hypothetical protein
VNPSDRGTTENSVADHHANLLGHRESGKFGNKPDSNPSPTPYAWLVLFLLVLNSMFNQW